MMKVILRQSGGTFYEVADGLFAYRENDGKWFAWNDRSCVWDDPLPVRFQEVLETQIEDADYE